MPNSTAPWPEHVTLLLRPGELAGYITDSGWSYGRLADWTGMAPDYLSRVAREGAPVKVVLAVMKATELVPRSSRVGRRGGKPPQHWVGILLLLDPSLTVEAATALIAKAQPITGPELRKLVKGIGKSYAEIAAALGVDKGQIVRAASRGLPTGKGIQAAVNLLFRQAVPQPVDGAAPRQRSLLPQAR